MSSFPKSSKKKGEILSIIENIKEEYISFSSGRIFGSMHHENLKKFVKDISEKGGIYQER